MGGHEWRAGDYLFYSDRNASGVCVNCAEEAKRLNEELNQKQKGKLMTQPISPHDAIVNKLLTALYVAAKDAYEDCVVDTKMIFSIIGPGLEFRDQQDWMDTLIGQWLDEASKVEEYTQAAWNLRVWLLPILVGEEESKHE